ncbi:necrosis inducing-like protein NPP1 type [Phytophthora cinnamomi]|uniref:necrosis inducing-like protein NPP1 type n=1 Tax=Phytophthora cinnamomi TaxID=4785 RepID=UPI003559E21C|nr:necrosis inducing-like protein NPP1 type [Phytophthora cinnamomi]
MVCYVDLQNQTLSISSPVNQIMNLLSLLITAIAATMAFSVADASIDHDKVQPFAQPEPVTISEKAAVKFKPSLLIQTGCYPYAAVNAAGETTGGLKATGKADSDCTGSPLGSQVYGRAIWHKDLWAVMYAWYFPKDIYFGNFFQKGQRHKWVSAVVWLDNPALEKPKILAVSTYNVDGWYAILKNGPPECGRRSCAPPFTDYINDTSPMLMYASYNKGSSVSTTVVRGGELQDLIMWEQLTDEARGALSETDFGEKAKVPFVDDNFKTNLEAARPFL